MTTDNRDLPSHNPPVESAATTDSWDDLYNMNCFRDMHRLSDLFQRSGGRVATSSYLVLAVIPAVLLFVTSWLSGTLYLDGDALGYLEDYIFAFFFISLPAMVVLVAVLVNTLPGTLHSLKLVIRRAEGDTDEPGPTMQAGDFNALLKKFETKITGVKGWYRVLKYGGHAVGVLYALYALKSHYFAVDTYTYDIWSSQDHLLNLAARTIYEVVLFGVVVPALFYKFLMVLHTIRAMFRALTDTHVIRLRPLSPDNAGGLGMIGGYSLKMVYVLLPALVPLLLYVLFMPFTPIIMIGLIVYIPLLILVFFYPLSGAHQAMKRYKTVELEFLARQFNRAYDTFTSRVGSETFQIDDEAAQAADLMSKIEELYNKANKMPVWPFNVQTLTRFGATVTIPLIIFAVDLLTNADSIIHNLRRVGDLF
ncbi:MAG: hypothetical protein KOO61_04470 [Spirochaetales bacterium]|nr:hypothetical protein [Spirochaetales bacterium]